MADLLRLAFGEGTDLNPWQMSARAVTVFIAALMMIRVAGRRSFGQHSAFDAWGVLSPRFERLIKGRQRVLVDAGHKDEAAMRAALISDRDLGEAMRKRFGDDELTQLDRAVLERDGEVSLRRKAVSRRGAHG